MALLFLTYFFADDLMCYCRASTTELRALKGCSDTFSAWSELLVNNDKSGMFWSKNVPTPEGKRIKQV